MHKCNFLLSWSGAIILFVSANAPSLEKCTEMVTAAVQEADGAVVVGVVVVGLLWWWW